MQKAIRINLLARNQAVKRAQQKRVQDTKDEWDRYQKTKVVQQKALRGYVKAERKSRREDWIQGPLAPKRDVGDRKAAYGAINVSLAQNAPIPKIARTSPESKGSDAIKESEGWVGQGMVGNVAVNDRVVVVRGKDDIRGRIGVVKSVLLETEEVLIEGFNTSDVELPSWQPQANKKEPLAFMSMDLPIPMSSVRLVYRLEDAETGFDRDVVVRHVRGGPPYQQRPHGSNLPAHTRYIAGEDIVLPWPEEEDLNTFTTEDADTPSIYVEKHTYQPDVFLPPLPTPSIMDELRPKYRRDRTRHNEEWVAKKVQEDARSIWWMKRKVLTPAQEKAEAEVRERKEREIQEGRGNVTEETQELIQKMMKANLGKSAKQQQQQLLKKVLA